MFSESTHLYIAQLTGDLTTAATIEAVGTGVLVIAVSACLYKLYNILVKSIEFDMKKGLSFDNNKLLVNDKATQYKIALIEKTAEEEGLTLQPLPNDEEEEFSLAQTFTEQVKKEIRK